MEAIHIVGNIGSPYGVYGWVHLYSATQNSDDIFLYEPLYLKNLGSWEKIKVVKWKKHNDHYLVLFDKFTSRTIAEHYVNAEIGADVASFADLEEGNYYWYQLMNLTVINKLGENLGTVVDILDTGANDVLVAKENDFEVLIPYLDHVILNVDLAKNTILVDWGKDY